MILEGLVTSRNSDGSPHLAPMGPTVDASLERLILRPFPTSHTCRNLLERPEGVFHITDDVLLLARAAIGVAAMPETLRADVIDGWILADACRAYEFRVLEADPTQPRVWMACDVVRIHRQRDFIGFHRARHAVLEAAILATRTEFLPLDDIANEFRRLAVIVEKTGSLTEHTALAELQAYLDRVRAERGET